MLIPPKGIKYWIDDEGELRIRDDAPEWAKKEFEKYWKRVETEPNEHGIISTPDCYSPGLDR